MEDVNIFKANLSILRPFDLVFGHLEYFIVIWYIFSRFGMLYQEKSCNPAYYQKRICSPWPPLIEGVNAVGVSRLSTSDGEGDQLKSAHAYS
jgi:hypothetical protein